MVWILVSGSGTRKRADLLALRASRELVHVADRGDSAAYEGGGGDGLGDEPLHDGTLVADLTDDFRSEDTTKNSPQAQDSDGEPGPERVKPRTCCRYRVSRKTSEVSVTNARILAMLLHATVDRLRIPRGTSGEAARRSTAT